METKNEPKKGQQPVDRAILILTAFATERSTNTLQKPNVHGWHIFKDVHTTHKHTETAFLASLCFWFPQCCHAQMHGLLKLLKYSNAQMLKCSTAQMLQCSNGSNGLKCSSARMLECSNAPMLKCSTAQMLDRSNAQMHKCTNAQMLQCSNARMLKHMLKWSMLKCSKSTHRIVSTHSEITMVLFEQGLHPTSGITCWMV